MRSSMMNISKDDGELIPFLIGEDECVKVAEEVVTAESVARAESEPEVKVAEELDATAMQATATGPKDGGGRIPFAAAETQRFIENDYGMKLTEQGLKSLDGQTWVLDEVISFVYGELSAAVINLQDIILVPVSQAHALTNLPSDSNPSEILPGDYSMYLFPVNDSVNHKRVDTGNHWSLLVLRLDWSRNECRCVHHDSIKGKNRATADRLVENLKRLFLTFHINCIQGQTPQQANLYDCGVYVIAISHRIAMWYKRVKNREKAEEDWIADVSKVTPKSVSDRRLQIYVNLKKRFRLRYPGHFKEESNNEGGCVE